MAPHRSQREHFVSIEYELAQAHELAHEGRLETFINSATVTRDPLRIRIRFGNRFTLTLDPALAREIASNVLDS